VRHSAKEYNRLELVHVNEDQSEFHFIKVHSNTVENVFSVFNSPLTKSGWTDSV
jgi:hypothetical protein